MEYAPLVYGLLGIAASIFAHQRSRSGAGWLIFAFLFSPLAAFVFLLILPPLPSASTADPRWKNLRAGVESTPGEVAAFLATAARRK